MLTRRTAASPPHTLDPGPGLTARMVLLPDGRRLRTVTAGTGPGPLVVFEAGMSAPAATWVHTQREVAAHARTLSYDRAGYGGSDPDPHDRSLERIVGDLAGLLDRLGERAPVVLVGHSWGGPIIRLFADRHPARVAGMVFVDATVAEYMSDSTARTTAVSLRLLSWLARIGLGGAVTRLTMPGEFSPEISRTDRAILLRDYACATAMHTGHREATRIAAALPTMRRLQATGTPAVPTVALVGGRVDRGLATTRPLLNRVTTELMTAVPDGRTVIVDDAGHLIPQECPGPVRDAVLDVVRAARPAGAAVDGRRPDPRRWQQRLEELAREHGIVGASLGIRLGDRTVEAAAGTLNMRTGAPVTPGSLFQIGSISKIYTTTVALRLVDEGRLDLEAPVTDVLPEFDPGDTDLANHLTLRHLLTHTSGLDGDALLDTGRGDDCLERFVAGLAGRPPVHPLGATWSYCNAGFVVAGRMIEKVTGRVWDDAVRELLFRPLGLGSTMTLPEEVLCHGAAHGHLPAADGTVGPAARWGIPRSSGPAGLVVATAREVLDVAALHLRGGLGPDGTRILSEKLTHEMRAHQVDLPAGADPADSWGLGWFRQDRDGRTVIGHHGATIGQASFLEIAPEHELSVCLLTNGGPARDLRDDLFPEIFAEHSGIRLPGPDTPPAPPVTVDTAGIEGVYERSGTRLEVRRAQDAAALTMHVRHTGGLGDLDLAPPTTLDLVPVSPGRFLTVLPGERHHRRVVVYEPTDGRPFLHFTGRATPRTNPS